MGSISYILKYLITAVPSEKKTRMKLLKFLLPFLVVASCSAFSLDALFSSEKKAEELPAEDSAAEEIDEDIDEEEEEIDEEDEEEEEEDELEEEETLEVVTLEEEKEEENEEEDELSALAMEDEEDEEKEEI